MAAEVTGQVLEQRRPVGDLTVHVPEKRDVADAADLGGPPRLLLPKATERLGVLAGVLHALLAGRDDDVAHVQSIVDPLARRARAPELDVVRMRTDDKGASLAHSSEPTSGLLAIRQRAAASRPLVG